MTVVLSRPMSFGYHWWRTSIDFCLATYGVKRMTSETQKDSLVEGYSDLWRIVYCELERRILGGQYASGSKLVETDLSEDLGVSRGPVRRALVELANNSLVVLESRKTARTIRVEEINVNALIDTVGALECAAIKGFAENSRFPEIAQFEAIQSDLEEALNSDDLLQAVNLDFCFHQTLVFSSNNYWLQKAWSSMVPPMKLLMLRTIQVDPTLAGLQGHHRLIINHLSSRNVEGSIIELSVHFEDVRRVASRIDRNL